MGVSRSGVKKTCIHVSLEKSLPLLRDMHSLSTSVVPCVAIQRPAPQNGILANTKDGHGEFAGRAVAVCTSASTAIAFSGSDTCPR